MDAGVIIDAKLNGENLKEQIDKLVNEVSDKFRSLATNINESAELVKTSIRGIKDTARSNVSQIKQAFDQLGTTFDQFARAMQRAAAAANGVNSRGGIGGGTGGATGGATAPQDFSNVYAKTIAELEEMIALQNKHIKTLQIGTEELQKQVDALTKGKNVLKEMTTSSKQNRQNYFKQEFGTIQAMSSTNITNTRQKLTELRSLMAHYEAEVRRLGMAKVDFLPQKMWNQLQKAIDTTEEKLKRLQNTASQTNLPNTFAGIKNMSENTLNEISTKMRAIDQLRRNTTIGSPELQKLNTEYERLSKRMSDVLGKSAEMVKSNNALGRAFNYVKNRLAFALSIGAITNFTKQLYEVRGQYELLERSLGVLVNSFSKGSEIFAELNAMAIKSPYTLIELGTAAKQLTAYNFEAKEVVNTTKRLADIASALGVPMERLVYNLGQIRAQTVLTARDARDFANAGLAVVPELAKYYTELEGKVVSTADVFDRMKKKAVSYNDVMAVLNKVTDEGGKFFDFQAKQAGTLKVQLANLNLAWNNMLNDIGKSNQSLLSLPVTVLKTLFRSWSEIANVLKNVAISFGIVKLSQIAYVAYTRNVNAAVATASVTNLKFVHSLQAVRNGLLSIVTSPLAWWTLLVTAILSVSTAFDEAQESLKQFNKNLRDAAKENVDNINSFLKDYSKIQVRLGSDTDTLSEEEAASTWEAIRSQIESTSGASDIFISKLSAIENVNERLKQSFNYLDTIKSVSAAIEKMDDKAIKIQQDWSKWWNFGLFNDSMFENVKDYTGSIEELELVQKRLSGETLTISERYRLFLRTLSEEDALEAISGNLERLRDNLDKTANSMYEFAKNKDWLGNPDAINEFFGQIGKKIIQEGLDKGWEPQDVFKFQLEFEEYRSKAAKQALQQRLNDEKEEFAKTENEKTRVAIKEQIIRNEQELNAWESNNGRGRVLWTEFTKWMENEHNSQVVTMYNKLTENGEKAMDYSNAKWKEFVNEMANDFAKENKLSQDDTFNHLMKWVNDANKQKIIIDLIIRETTQRSVYDTLTDADKAADDAYGAVKRLGQEIDRLNNKRKKAKGLVEQTKVDAQILKTEKERTKEQENYNKALEKGGRSKAAEADAKKAESAANKRNNAAKKEQKQAEDDVAKSLKEEISVINEMQSAYDKLRKAGVGSTEALAMASSGYDKTLKSINATLSKYGISAFKAEDFVGSNDPHKLLNALTNQLNTLLASGKVKTASLKDLEMEIKKITVDAREFDMKKITDGLNNELGKIKEEYELAVELDANPELGGIFADMMGISREELQDLPHDYAQLMDKLQGIIDQTAGKIGFSLVDNLNKSAFDQWITEHGNELEDGFAKALNSIREYANKVRLDETKKITEEWSKLLEKYGEYEAKRTAIAKQAEQDRAIAIKNNADKSILNAINRREQQAYAKLDFDEFQKSATWITATGNLSNLTNTALELLIQRINEYKKEAKNLEPKEILKLNKALRQLRKEQMKNNPFKIFAIASEEAKERAEEYDVKIAEVQQQINDLGLAAKRKEGIIITDEEKKLLDELLKKLKKLREEKEEVSKIPLEKKAEQVQKYVEMFKQFSDAFKSFADSTNNQELKQVAKAISDVTDVISSVVSGVATGGWIGGVVAGLSSAIPKILDFISGNDAINYSIERSEIQIKNLTNLYKKLEHEAEKAYGVEAYGAQKALISVKQLELAELERQLALEKSRKGKYRDDAAIADLKGQIIDLKNEINDATEDIVNDLLGITSKADFAENLVKSMIDAFKSGEDYMKVFEESFEDMVDNMIMKAIVSRLVGDWINKIFDQVNQKAMESDRAKSAQAEIDRWTKRIADLESGSVKSGGRGHLTEEQIAAALEEAKAKLAQAEQDYIDAITPTPEDIAGMREIFQAGKEDFKNNFLAYMDMFGIEFGQNAGIKDLSALQQGIQGITEDTAGALESYMNSVSQQVYYQSDILTQIRDILVNFGGDVTIATNAQILFELQQSYQVQMSIQSILQGWSNASGLAVRVELAN